MIWRESRDDLAGSKSRLAYIPGHFFATVAGTRRRHVLDVYAWWEVGDGWEERDRRRARGQSERENLAWQRLLVW